MKKHYLLIIIALLTIQIVTATINWNITYCHDGICEQLIEPGAGTSDTIWTILGPYLYNNSGSLDFNETMLNTTIEALTPDGTGLTNTLALWSDSDTLTNSSIIENSSGIHFFTDIQMHYKNGETEPATLLLDAPSGASYQSSNVKFESKNNQQSNYLPFDSQGKDTSNYLSMQSTVSDGGGYCSGTLTCIKFCSSLPKKCASPCYLTTNGCFMGTSRCASLTSCGLQGNQASCEALPGCTWTESASYDPYTTTQYTDDSSYANCYSNDGTNATTFAGTGGSYHINITGPSGTTGNWLTDDGYWTMEGGYQTVAGTFFADDTGVLAEAYDTTLDQFYAEDDYWWWDDGGIGAVYSDDTGFYFEDAQPYGNVNDYIHFHDEWTGATNTPIIFVETSEGTRPGIQIKTEADQSSAALVIQNNTEDDLILLDADGGVWAYYFETPNGYFHAEDDYIQWDDGSIGYAVDNTGMYVDFLQPYYEDNLTIYQEYALINETQVVCTAENGLCAGATSAGGSNTEVQFNNGGSLAGSSNFTYDDTTGLLTLQGISTNNILNINDNTADTVLSIQDDGQIYSDTQLKLYGTLAGNTAYAMKVIAVTYPDAGAGAGLALQPYIYPQTNLASAYGTIRLTRLGAYGGTSYNLTTLNNVFDRIDILNNNTITNAYNYRINDANEGGGHITNQYGIFISDLTAGESTNYPIYTGTGTVHLGDDVEVTGNITVNGGDDVCTAENGLCADGDTTYNSDETYIYESANTFYLNETLLNTTIDARETYVDTTGDTMTGNLTMNENNIINITILTFQNGCYMLSNTTGVYTIC